MITLPKLPTAEIWPDMIQGSVQWLSARKGRITASNLHKIVTPTGRLSKQSESYARKLARESVLDDPLEYIGNKYTDWGNANESEARQEFIKLTGLDVIQVGFVTHETITCAGCSPDGLIVGDCDNFLAGLEIKCPQIDNLVEWALEGKIPQEHLPQIHASMAITGLKKWHFAGYFPGVPLFVPPPAEWNEYTEKIKEAIENFVVGYVEIRPKVLSFLTGKEPK